jgi:hypothetical protein
MTEPHDEPVQPKALTHLAQLFALDNLPEQVVSRDQLERHRRTVAAAELMKRTHLQAFVDYNDFRRKLIAMVNEAKAQDPVGAEFLDDFVKEALADYHDELKRLVAAQNQRYREEATRETVEVVQVRYVTPLEELEQRQKWSPAKIEPIKLIGGLLLLVVACWIAYYFTRVFTAYTIFLAPFVLLGFGASLALTLSGLKP